MKWDYAILATGKTHFSNVKTNRINNKIAFGTNLKVENKCRLTNMCICVCLCTCVFVRACACVNGVLRRFQQLLSLSERWRDIAKCSVLLHVSMMHRAGPISPGFILLMLSLLRGKNQYHYSAFCMRRQGLEPATSRLRGVRTCMYYSAIQPVQVGLIHVLLFSYRSLYHKLA